MIRRLQKFSESFVKGCICLFLLLLAACDGGVLVEGLNSRQSIEAIVRLGQAGIPAKRLKSESSSGLYDLSVRDEFQQRAYEVLHEYSLPRTDKENFFQVTKARGFVPNSREIAALRLDHALALELERLLEVVPGIVEVKAVVRTGKEGSKVSLVIKYTKIGNKKPFELAEIESVLLHTVPNLEKEFINISSSELFISSEQASSVFSTVWPFKFSVDDGQVKSVSLQIGLAVLISIVSGFAFGLIFGSRSRRLSVIEVDDSKKRLAE